MLEARNSYFMTEKELITKLKELKRVKPDKDWAILAKSQILGAKERKPSLAETWNFLRFILKAKPAFAGALLVFLTLGVSVMSANALPGELLYPLKKITEKSKTFFVSEKGRSTVNLELTNKRLEELTQITETNQTKKLAAGVSEFKESASQAAKDLKGSKKMTREIVSETRKIIENKEKVE